MNALALPLALIAAYLVGSLSFAVIFTGRVPFAGSSVGEVIGKLLNTQPEAMADASVFHRATMACMDARGYTSR